MPPPLSPPPPETSSKRILPAFLLCFALSGTHRIYAGKFISGILQIAFIAGSTIWAYESVKSLIPIVESNSADPMTVIQNISDWQQAHGSAASIPSLLSIAAGIWIAVDAARLLRGKFTDGKGLRITRWI